MSDEDTLPLGGITVAFFGNRPGKLQKQVRDHGGQIAASPADDGVTHVVVVPSKKTSGALPTELLVRCVTPEWLATSIASRYPVEEAPFLCDSRGALLKDSEAKSGRLSTTPSQGRKRKAEDQDPAPSRPDTVLAAIFPVECVRNSITPPVHASFFTTLFAPFSSAPQLVARLRGYLHAKPTALTACLTESGAHTEGRPPLHSPLRMVRTLEGQLQQRCRTDSIESLCLALQAVDCQLEASRLALDEAQSLAEEGDEAQAAVLRAVGRVYEGKARALLPTWVVRTPGSPRLLAGLLATWEEACLANGVVHRMFARLGCGLRPATERLPYVLFLAAVEAAGGPAVPAVPAKRAKPAAKVDVAAEEFPAMHREGATLLHAEGDPFPPTWRAGKPRPSVAGDADDPPEEVGWKNSPCVGECFAMYSEPLSRGFARYAGMQPGEGGPPKGVAMMWCCYEADELVGLLRCGVRRGQVLGRSLQEAIDTALASRPAGYEGTLCAVLVSVHLKDERPVRPKGLLSRDLLQLQLQEIDEEEILSASQRRRRAHIQSLLDAAKEPQPTLPSLPGMTSTTSEVPCICPYAHVTRHTVTEPAACLPHYIFTLTFPEVP